jgi:hypothetical protein
VGRIRNRRRGGFKFVRQRPIGRYYADFVCRDLNLIVELDAKRRGMERATVPVARKLAVISVFRGADAGAPPVSIKGIQAALCAARTSLDRARPALAEGQGCGITRTQQKEAAQLLFGVRSGTVGGSEARLRIE